MKNIHIKIPAGRKWAQKEGGYMFRITAFFFIINTLKKCYLIILFYCFTFITLHILGRCNIEQLPKRFAKISCGIKTAHMGNFFDGIAVFL